MGTNCLATEGEAEMDGAECTREDGTRVHTDVFNARVKPGETPFLLLSLNLESRVT